MRTVGSADPYYHSTVYSVDIHSTLTNGSYTLKLPSRFPFQLLLFPLSNTACHTNVCHEYSFLLMVYIEKLLKHI